MWLSILPFEGVRKFAVIACACVLTAAVLVAGYWCSVTSQRQWLWVFLPLLSGALTLTGVCFTNNAASIHARYRRHWGYLTLPALFGLGLGFVAAFVPAEKAPTLQHLQYVSQSMVGLVVVYSIQVMGAVSAHKAKRQVKVTSQAPRWDRSSPHQGQSRESLIAERVSFEEIILEDLESLLVEEDLSGPRTREGCEPRPDSLTLSDIT